MRRIVLILGLLVGSGALAAPADLEVQGHRGARARWPENTLAAFRYALEVGVDTLELDVAVTRDDRLVVSHDLRVPTALCQRADGQPLPEGLAIRALTLAEVQALDCGSKRHPRFPEQQLVPGERMPTLEQVFALVEASPAKSARAVRFNVETKLVPGEPELGPSPQRFAELVLAAVDRAGMRARVTVQSFDHRTLRALAALAPDLHTVALVEECLPDLVAVARAAGATTVSPNHLWITEDDVARLHAAGLRVVPWTANEPVQWQRLLALAVDGIITDDPERLLAWLRLNGRTQRPSPVGDKAIERVPSSRTKGTIGTP
ncbi:MAG: glycerophosphodiester phosphodiesterase [Deltaproteobacteria bacterium]|nr:glycerophosphodiester phosphodiesterase [Deltaproteobacteria bacterium]